LTYSREYSDNKTSLTVAEAASGVLVKRRHQHANRDDRRQLTVILS